MTKIHGGTHHIQGKLNRSPRSLPAGGPYHVGSGAPKGRVHHGVAPRIFANHGGTALKMGKLKRK
jgi:hypothetical protein